MANWTKAQLKAIETKDKTLLVSAAAGSGKTTVLIERLIRSITNPEAPADISRLLIVTFTRAAASELKQRIAKALSTALSERPDDRRLFKQLSALGNAHISTIDSFYADVVRNNAQLLGIPQNLRIADDSELIKLRRKAMNEAIDIGYSGELSVSAEEFASTADALSDMRNDAALCDVFYDLYEKLLGHPHGINFLMECTESYESSRISDFFDSDYGRVVKNHVKGELVFLCNILKDALEYLSEYDAGVQSPFISDLRFCTEALAILEGKSYTELRAHFNTYSPERLKTIKKDQKTPEAEYFYDLRTDTVKSKIRKLNDAYFGAGFSEDELHRYAEGSALRTKTLYSLLSVFDSIYKEEKLSASVCEFSDIKLWAYELLVNTNGTPTELALSIADSFDSVYIDEYQDVDCVQDLIFRAVSKPRGRFMVGDVKQSIYGFRGAEPSLFMNYRTSFASIDKDSDTLPDSDDCTIFMSENFRCDKTIIDFANRVCSYLFRTAGKNIEYRDEDDLVFSKPIDTDHAFSKVILTVIDRKDSEAEFENAEAAYVASEINRLISTEKKADGSPITASDIAVLSRGYSFCTDVEKALDKYGIKHSSSGASSLFDDPEVSMALSILNVIDNPMRDVHLAAAMMSPVFGFDADMLISLRKSAEGQVCSLYDAVTSYAKKDDRLADRCRTFISIVSELREDARSLSADKVIRLVFSRFSLLSRERAREPLTALYENARSYEGDSFKGLYGYLRHVDEMIKNGTSTSKGAEDSSDGVKLMTIHKSKGLEFPVCFVSNCAASFNRDDAKDPILYAQGLGMATDLMDETGFGKIRTPYRKALSRYILDVAAEEEMRILYVALTRGRERLYVTADPRYGAQREFNIAETARKYGEGAGILDSSNYISWILTSTYPQDGSEDCYSLTVLNRDEIPPLPDIPPISEMTDVLPESDEGLADRIRKNLEYVYPHLHISNLPAKLSVSALSPSVLDRTEDVTEEADSSLDVKLPSVSVPSFMAEHKATGAEKGIATHTFLQFCDLRNTEKSGVREELSRLVALGFMDRSMAELVNVKQIEAFFKSELYSEISKAKKVYREQRFNILLPASDFTEDEEYASLIENEKLLVQGVIDIFFESDDGTLTLCDYKTDYLSPEELKDASLAKKKLTDAHSRQLSYYAAALGEIVGKLPDRVIIYSLPFGGHFEIAL